MKTFADEVSRQGMADGPMLHDNTYDADFVAAANGVFEGEHVRVRSRPFEVEVGNTLEAFMRYTARAGGPLTDGATVGWIDDDLAYRVVNSQFAMVGVPSKPFNCWPGDGDAWSVPIPTNFD